VSFTAIFHENCDAAEGTVYTAHILSRDDLNRQIVRSPSCTIVIPEYELTLPPSRGQLTTVEGLIRHVIADLSGDQPLRRVLDEAAHTKIQSLINKLKDIIAEKDEDRTQVVCEPAQKEIPMPAFTIKLDDPAGNSFIEFIGSIADPKWKLRTYHRTRQQNIDLGLSVPDEAPEEPSATPARDPTPLTQSHKENGHQGTGKANDEILVFHGACPSCRSPLDTLMKSVSIPHFKVC
jgi:zinc finger protein